MNLYTKNPFTFKETLYLSIKHFTFEPAAFFQ